MENKKKDVWKPIAILFIILFVLETAFFGYVLYEGTKIIKNEEICSFEVCANYSAFLYHSGSNLCECFDRERNVVLKEYLE